MSMSNMLAQIIGEQQQRRVEGPPSAGEMPAIIAAAQEESGPPLKIRRFLSDDGPAFWRWDCAHCGEYGGGRHHSDAINRATRHCVEHPEQGETRVPNPSVMGTVTAKGHWMADWRLFTKLSTPPKRSSSALSAAVRTVTESRVMTGAAPPVVPSS